MKTRKLIEVFGSNVEQRVDSVLLVNDLIGDTVVERQNTTFPGNACELFLLLAKLCDIHPCVDAVKAQVNSTAKLGIVEGLWT